MANGSINYDYDEVISLCGSVAPDIEELCYKLNSFEGILNETLDLFHAATSENNLTKIYYGFSNIIGSTNEVSGLGGISVVSKNIIDVIYSEALNDKQICEGDIGGTSSESGFDINSIDNPPAIISDKDIGEMNIDPEAAAQLAELYSAVGNDSMQCVELVKRQMIEKGLLDGEHSLGNGCSVVNTLLSSPDILADGHSVTNIDAQTFIDMLNSGQDISNVVISFSGNSGHYKTDAGHVMFVDQIKGGNTYMIDNYDTTTINGSSWGSGATDYIYDNAEFIKFISESSIANIAIIN